MKASCIHVWNGYHLCWLFVFCILDVLGTGVSVTGENLPFLTNFRGSSLSKAPHSRAMLRCLRAYATVTSLPTNFTLWSKILLTEASQTGARQLKITISDYLVCIFLEVRQGSCSSPSHCCFPSPSSRCIECWVCSRHSATDLLALLYGDHNEAYSSKLRRELFLSKTVGKVEY